MGRLLQRTAGGATRSRTGNPPRLGAERPVRQEQAEGILVAALRMLAAHLVDGEAKRAFEECKGDTLLRSLFDRRAKPELATATAARDLLLSFDLTAAAPGKSGKRSFTPCCS
jgi:hypothetical protein